MSTSAVTPFRSFVQTPVFSVSPSSLSLQRIVINIIMRRVGDAPLQADSQSSGTCVSGSTKVAA